MPRTHKVLAVLACAGLALTAACSSSGGSSGSKGGPIVIGSDNTLSGSATFPEASQAAKAVFDRVNSEGGIDGRKIKYVALDDKQDPATAAQNARKLVTQQNAVVLAGSGGLLDCAVNAPFYKQSGISSVPGVGVDPACFASQSISPVNVGPYLSTQINLQYATDTLKLKKICAFFTIIANTQKAYQAAVDNWSKRTGQKLALNDTSVTPTTTDYTPVVLKAKNLGCDGIAFNGVEPQVIGMAKAMAAQNMTKTTLLVLSSVYTAQAAKAIGNPAFPIYAPAEFAPYSDPNDSANSDWRKLMQKDDIPLTAFAQGGYLAATYVVDVLKGIKGDITRKSVTSALRSMKPISNPMSGSKWVFGTATVHNPNQSVKIVRLSKGAWTPVGNDFVTASS